MQAHIHGQQSRRLLITLSSALATLTLLPAGLSGQTPSPAAQPIGRAVISWGEISANDVYVRSGNSTNHYTICKLSAGDRVAIVGDSGEWLEILPPDGTFSLISGDYVDTTDDKSGVVNGDNVRVRAGSSLNDNKYTVQTMLSRGARVTILGRNPDGFLRITPPTGATLWIHRDYIAPSADRGTVAPTKIDTESTTSTQEGTASGTPQGGVLGSPVAPGQRSEVSASAHGTNNWRAQLQEIDTLAKAELDKPPAEREFDAFVERYRAISEQEEDGYARHYARTRLDQIESMVAVVSAIERVQRLGDAADAKRREFLAARATIPTVVPPSPTGIEVQGELRISALYPPGSSLRRYRLIDPTASYERTIGYVEIPPDSRIQIDEFIGRFVGVRASDRRLQTGGVDPVPVYIARELVLLDPPKSATAPNGTTGQD